ncbi:DR2241 family protein [Halomicroarcula sp. GCM10025817]|uniref:DR2241 family protein n=1 Tax=Haloarcula TaxID=2237 RepID=UPI0023E7C24F|nr:DR2241 family protein [Halomicroarcula sp. SYNS111]
MHGDHVDALVATAPDGIAFDDLRVDREGDRYAFETPEETHGALNEDDLRAVAADSPFVRNWYFWHAVAPQKADRWAFLRWLEDAEETALERRLENLADGVVSEWGQLRVTATVDDGGERRYHVRHVDDARADPAALTAHEDPRAARDLAKHDERGRYRPLKSAPTLRTGWRFADRSAADLVETVETFYPASVANWHREREGELDVTHWHETVERQTGIYGVVQTWDRGEGYEHVNWVAEACCADSQCLKRREWHYDDETELDVDGGDGVVPCREPCSVVIAAARQWTKLESEESRTYEFELTPSEKEQVEGIVDAVADGSVGDIREADVYEDANRYRARFLRAKRFDGEGNLSGAPTDRDGGE